MSRRIARLREVLRSRRQADRGAIAVIFALSMSVILASAAFAFDIGRVVDANRSMQSVADAVALDTAATLDGSYAGLPDPASSTGQTLAQYAASQALLSAARNNFVPGGNNQLTIQLGTYTPTGGFVSVLNSDTGTTIPTAVRVYAGTVTQYPFGAALGAFTRNSSSSGTSLRHAIALRNFGCNQGNGGPGSLTPAPGATSGSCSSIVSGSAVSGFTIGSYVANVDTTQSQILNSLLSGALGLGSAQLSAVSYQGLADSNITLNNLLSANAGVGTLSNLLNTKVSPSTLLGYLANAVGATAGADPDLTAKTSIQTIGATSSSAQIQLCKLISLSGSAPCGISDPSPAANAELNSLDLVRLIAEAANGSNALTVNGGVGLGLITVQGSLINPIAVAAPGPATNAAGQHPVTATDQQGNITLSLNTGLVAINLKVTAATSTGTLTNISCAPTPQATTTQIGVSSTAAVITPQIVVSLLGLASINMNTPAVSVGGNSGTLMFNGPFNAQNFKSQGTAEPNITLTASAPSGLIASTVSAVTNTLTPVLNLLNPLLSPLLSALGVNLGGATVANNTLTCGIPSLAG